MKADALGIKRNHADRKNTITFTKAIYNIGHKNDHIHDARAEENKSQSKGNTEVK